MKKALVLAVSFLTTAFTTPVLAQNALSAVPAATSSFPIQLEMRVPVDPTAFPSVDRTYLTYELYLTNISGYPMTLHRIEVLDADGAAAKSVAALEGEQIDSLLQHIGADVPNDSTRQLDPGTTTIVFMWIPFESGVRVPNGLRHRVFTADSSVEGAVIGTHRTKLHVLGPPVEGTGWSALGGPGNERDNHHRRGIFVTDGRITLSRRYAIDWMQMQNGVAFTGNEHEASSYYSYGKAVLAVASGIVVAARDGLPDNNPGHFEAFHPAVPITLETVAGNIITLDLGDGQFAHYFHLQPGSVRVRPGDRVRRGEVLARIGGSGDAREPHLHFEVTTSAQQLAGEGVPYLIERYRSKMADSTWQTRTRELPLNNMLLDFEQGDSAIRR